MQFLLVMRQLSSLDTTLGGECNMQMSELCIHTYAGKSDASDADSLFAMPAELHAFSFSSQHLRQT